MKGLVIELDKSKLAQKIYDFLSKYDALPDYDTYGTSVEQVEESLSIASDVDRMMKDIDDVCRTFDSYSEYADTAKPLLLALEKVKADLNRRMVGDTGYEVKHAVHIGDKEIIFAVDMNADKGLYYLVCNATRNELFEQFTDGSGDYLEMMKEFIDRVGGQIESVRSEQEQINLPDTIFTAEHCYPNDYRQSIDGKVVAIRADVLRPEYRRGDNQLVLVAGGFGANANARGSAVFCYHLNNGKHTRFERHEVLGVVKELPDWAKERLAAVKSQMTAEHAKSKKDRGDAR